MNKKGFTLIELLIAIAIIGLFSMLIVVFYGSARLKARDARRMADLKQVQTALELYYNEIGSYPTENNANLGNGNYLCLEGGVTPGFKISCTNPYLQSVPKDPGSNNYTYSSTGTTYTVAAGLEGVVNGMTSGITLGPSGITD